MFKRGLQGLYTLLLIRERSHQPGDRGVPAASSSTVRAIQLGGSTARRPTCVRDTHARIQREQCPFIDSTFAPESM
jgi:hypothetical protein